MSLIKEINLPLDKPFILTLASSYGAGKTTCLAILAAELAYLGNSVLFITEDSSNKIIKKFLNLGLHKMSKITIMRYYDTNRKMVDLIGGRNFDYVFFDAPTKKEIFDEINLIKHNQKISFFVSTQLQNNGYGLGDIKSTNKPIQISDLIVVFTKKIFKNNLIDKIKNFFGLKFKNRRFTIIKNRHGKEFSFDYDIDFDKINQ